jgi:hypothetical protein
MFSSSNAAGLLACKFQQAMKPLVPFLGTEIGKKGKACVQK